MAHVPQTKQLSEWSESVAWAEVLNGKDVGQSQSWLATTESDGQAWTSPEAYGAWVADDNDDNPEPEATVVVSEDGHRLELVDGAERPLWWPGEARPVDKLAAWAGVRGLTRAQAVERLGVHEDPAHWEWFWTGPVLEAIRDAADMRKANRWGVLGAVLAWTAAHIPQEAYLGGDEKSRESEASLNMFVASVGRPGDGKGTSIKTAVAMLGWDALRGGRQPGLTNSGSVEGLAELVSIHPEPEDGEDDDQRRKPPANPAYNPDRRYLVKVAEISRLFGERRANGGDSTQEGYLLSMWFGEDLSANLKRDSRYVPDQSYRMCLHVGAQPHLAYRLMADTANGLAQRFLYFPALPLEKHENRGDSIDTLPRVWLDPAILSASGTIPQDPGVTREVSRLSKRRRYRTRDQANVDAHREVSQLKVAAVLNALLHGEVAVTREAWDLAGVIMEASDLVRVITVRDQLDRAEETALKSKVDERTLNDRAQEEVERSKVERVATQLTPWLPADWQPLSSVTLRANSRDRVSKNRDIPSRVDEAIALLVQQGKALVRKNPGGGGGHQIKAAPAGTR